MIPELQGAEERTKLYVQQVEQWKHDHLDAMRCFDFEDKLRFGIAVFDSLIRFDEFWRARVAKGERKYDPRVPQAIRTILEWWVRPCASVEKELQRLEHEYGTIEDAQKFRAACADADWILNHADRLGNDRLAALEDKALNEHRRGETLPFEKPGD